MATDKGTQNGNGGKKAPHVGIAGGAAGANGAKGDRNGANGAADGADKDWFTPGVDPGIAAGLIDRLARSLDDLALAFFESEDRRAAFRLLRRTAAFDAHSRAGTNSGFESVADAMREATDRLNEKFNQFGVAADQIGWAIGHGLSKKLDFVRDMPFGGAITRLLEGRWNFWGEADGAPPAEDFPDFLAMAVIALAALRNLANQHEGGECDAGNDQPA